MIEQYLSNTNEITTVLILPKILELETRSYTERPHPLQCNAMAPHPIVAFMFSFTRGAPNKNASFSGKVLICIFESSHSLTG